MAAGLGAGEVGVVAAGLDAGEVAAVGVGLAPRLRTTPKAIPTANRTTASAIAMVRQPFAVIVHSIQTVRRPGAGQASSARRLIAAPHVHVIQTRSPSTPPSRSPQYWCS